MRKKRGTMNKAQMIKLLEPFPDDIPIVTVSSTGDIEGAYEEASSVIPFKVSEYPDGTGLESYVEGDELKVTKQADGTVSKRYSACYKAILIA